MPRTLSLLFALATLSAAAYAQSPDAAGSATITSQTPAPIVRSAPAAGPRITSTQPIPGVWLQTDQNSAVTTVSADANGTEVRVERGRANVQVHHPADNAQILVDLPGGQVSLLKDGLYTFNAETNTVRVLHGEAEAYTGAASSTAKGIKVKEDHQLVLAANAKAVETDPRQMTADLLPGPGAPRTGEGYRGEGYRGGGYYGPNGDDFYPAYGYAYPYAAYGWGDPFLYPGFGWGYPYGFGFGFGYYGGFGGYRGYGRFGRR